MMDPGEAIGALHVRRVAAVVAAQEPTDGGERGSRLPTR